MCRFFIIILLFPSICLGQIDESFDDGDHTASPAWQGMPQHFIVNSSHQLQLNAPDGISEAWLFTESMAIEQATWTFWLKLDFNPSANNYARVYLAVDKADPAQIQNGVFVEIGQSTDDICLYSLNAGQRQKMIDGLDDRVDLAAVEIQIRVTRENKHWQLETNTGTGWKTEGNIDYEPPYASSFFGIQCLFTATRSTKFFFDDIQVTGSPYVDTDPPTLISFDIRNGEHLSLVFSEQIDTASLHENQFHLSALNRQPSNLFFPENSSTRHIDLYFNPGLTSIEDELLAISGVKDMQGNNLRDTALTFSYERVYLQENKANTPLKIELQFSKTIDEQSLNEALIELNPKDVTITSSEAKDNNVIIHLENGLEPERLYALKISGIKDITGDTILTTSTQLLHYLPKRFDVVFTEFMTDPSPQIGLPESEFIELFNRCPYPINLENWCLSVNGNSTSLPVYRLAPEEYVLLVPESKSNEWRTITNKVHPDSWKALNKTSGDLILTDASGQVIDALRYHQEEWSVQNFKDEGGWSYECMDPSNRSASPDNWFYSVDSKGGTPASVNSLDRVNPDTRSPYITKIVYQNPMSIELTFSEPMDFSENNLLTKFIVKGSSATISQILFDSVFLAQCQLLLENELKMNQVHQLADIAMMDMAGHVLNSDITHRFGRPDSLLPLDLVINEILFNPGPNGVDFIEVYNLSQKILTVKDLHLGTCDEAQNLKDIFSVSDDKQLLFPDDHLVLTPEPAAIMSDYHCKYPWLLFKLYSFPSLPDDEGNVALALKDGRIIDFLHYDEDMHFSLLNSTEGVSLERLSPEALTNSTVNWHSAAASCGYATPTYINSQYLNRQATSTETFLITPELFTPNSDGIDDLLIINYTFDEPETVGTTIIYNDRGIPVKHLNNNQLLGTAGFYTWDGTNDDGKCVTPGIYIVLVETFRKSGEKQVFKETCVVGIRQNQ